MPRAPKRKIKSKHFQVVPPSKRTLQETHRRSAYLKIESALYANSSLSASKDMLIFRYQDNLTYRVQNASFLIQEEHIRAFIRALHGKGLISLARLKATSIELDLTPLGTTHFLRIQFAAPPKIEPRKPLPAPVPKAASPLKMTKANQRLADDATIPTVNAMLYPLLESISDKKLKHSQIVQWVARSLKFPIDGMSIAKPEGTNNTFDRNFTIAFSRLVEQGFVHSVKKIYTCSPKGLQALKNSGELIPKMKESTIKAAKQDWKTATEHTVRLNTEKPQPATVLGGLSQVEMHKLIEMWRNALKPLTDIRKKTMHQKAREMVEAVTAEWERRARLPNSDDYFAWPTTEANRGDGNLSFKAQSEGMLSYLDYRVGNTKGQPSATRRLILSRIFENSLPPVFERAHMLEWGPNQSAMRLKKIADCLSSFARNGKRRDDDRWDEAIRQWEEDLDFMHDKYYVGHFYFGWPSARVDGHELPRPQP